MKNQKSRKATGKAETKPVPAKPTAKTQSSAGSSPAQKSPRKPKSKAPSEPKTKKSPRKAAPPAPVVAAPVAQKQAIKRAKPKQQARPQPTEPPKAPARSPKRPAKSKSKPWENQPQPDRWGEATPPAQAPASQHPGLSASPAKSKFKSWAKRSQTDRWGDAPAPIAGDKTKPQVGQWTPKPKEPAQRDRKPFDRRQERQRSSGSGEGSRRSDRDRNFTARKDRRVEPTKSAPSLPSSDETNDKLSEKILRIISHPSYRPMDKVELSKKLGLPSEDRQLVRKSLEELEQSGAIVRVRKERYVLPDEADLRVGTITFHENGFAFVMDEKHPGKDLFIPAQNTWIAMQGDTVVARIERDGRGGGGFQGRVPMSQRDAGRVIRILKRHNPQIVGTLQRSQKFFYVVADDPRFIQNVYVTPGISPDGKTAKVGDKVVVKLTEWVSRHVNPEGEIIEVLGSSDAPGVDMLSIIRKFNLPMEFPPNVLEEAADIDPVIEESEIQRREDLRQLPIFTIDPDDARDFDDAIHVLEKSGGWELGVHIADVSAYVEPGSLLDIEAHKRGNSVYLADRVIPMLPEKLSNGLCSLRPNEDKLTFSVFAEFTKAGKFKRARFARTVIRSQARLTYKQAFAILQKPADSPVAEHVHRAWALASKLRRLRFDNGALDLDMPEVKVWLNSSGRPERIERVENDISHQLIEEFMLIANELVARETKNAVAPSVYRIHEKPDPEKLFEYRQLVSTYGYKAGDLTQKGELQKLIAAFRGSTDEPALKIGLLKSLKRACYDPRPLGHYGLAKVNYTHFTSPIRRYADLIVHRVLGALILKTPVSRENVSTKNLSAVAKHISDTERVAAEAERESVKLKKLEFFLLQSEAQERQKFKAIVTDAKNYGLVVELPELVISGLVHVSSLSGDFYTFDPVRLRFFGKKTKKSYGFGDELQVEVDRVDLFKRQVDFRLAEERPLPKKKKK